jgi:type III secretion protein R
MAAETINPIGLVVTIASLSVLPLVAVTATSFLKISAVLLILRNAIGVQQVPSNMVLYGVSMVMSLLIMGPVLTDAGHRFAPDGKMPVTGVEVLTSINDAVPPFKQFMLKNLNADYLEKFYETAQQFQKKYNAPPIEKTDLFIVMPAFVASELSEAFRIGLYLYLPFVIIDLAVSSGLMALGMMMVSPMSITVPLKIVLFVAVEGWAKILQGLVNSYLG